MCNYEMNQVAVLFSRVLEEAADVHHLDCGFGDPRKLGFSVSVSRVETEGKDSQKCISKAPDYQWEIRATDLI